MESNTITELNQTAFKDYTAILTKLSKLRDDPAVKKYFLLQAELDRNERIIKEGCRSTGEGLENKKVRVSVIKNWRKWYDFSIIQEKATEKELHAIIENCLIQDVNKVEFEQLVKDEIVSKELKVAAFKEQEMTPRVQIKRL